MMKKILINLSFLFSIALCGVWSACEDVEPSCDFLAFNSSYADVNDVFYCPTDIQSYFWRGLVNDHPQEEIHYSMTTLTETGCLENVCTELSLTIRTPWPNVDNIEIPETFTGTLTELSGLGLILELTQVLRQGQPEVVLIDPYARPNELEIKFLLNRQERNVPNCGITGIVAYNTSDKLITWDTYWTRF